MAEALPIALVDAENVRRSRWPNLGREELVEACRAWAVQSGAEVVVVFDGDAPGSGFGEHVLDARCSVVGTSGESADDWIARRADELAAGTATFWLVTSDRGLRERAGGGAARTVGGGTFVRELEGLSS